MNDDLPSSYTTLFGPMDHAEGNEARSVLSPAAYLVDLLELRDRWVSGWTDYHQRRLDVRDIPLTQANTYTEIPFLDVANQVMGALASDETLRKGKFPPPLPFAEQQLRLKLYAEKLGTGLEEIQRLYRSTVDAHATARLRLGLSQEEYDLFVATHDPDQLKLLWGVSDLETLRGADVELIKKKLGLSLKELKRLVRQDLADVEAGAAASFFINQGANPIVLEDEVALKLRLQDGAALSDGHLDRMMRFVRLARRLELDLVDLDWLLQTACGNALGPDALQAIAVALDLRRLSDELSIDDACSLWSVLRWHGRGDGVVPADPFDRVYNNDFPKPLAQHVSDLKGIGATSDALDDRLQATLRLSGADFASLKAALLERGAVKPALEYDPVVAWFSAFRRIALLAELLSLSVQEVVMLLDVLGAQWAASEHDDLSIPLPFPASAPPPPLALLLQPDAPPTRTMDVLQKLVRVKAWLDLRQLSPRQLAFICLEDHLDFRRMLEDGSPIDDVQPDDAVEAALDDFSQSLRDAMVTPATLQTGSLTAAGAAAAFESLRAARVLVTFDDPARGLLRVQPSADELEEAMRQGLHERLAVHPGDLGALGITDMEPLFALLVAHGYLEAVGEGEELQHFIAPGLEAYFASPSGASAFTAPNYQAHGEAVFAALAERVDAPVVEAAALVAAGVDAEDVPALFQVLQAHGYVEPLPGTTPAQYRVASDEAVKGFLGDPANATRLALPNFAAVFPVLAAKVEAFQRVALNRDAESLELGDRLSALSEQQGRLWIRGLSGLLGLSEDLAGLAFAWAFGTPDEAPEQTLAALALPLFRARGRSEPALSDAYLASRFRRLQQLSLLLRKTKVSADEARVFLKNQQVHRRLPETLKVPSDFLETPGKVDALTTLPSGDFVVLSGSRYAAFSRRDYSPLGTGALEELFPGLPDAFRGGLDAAFSDTGADGKPVLHLCAGDKYVTVSASGLSGVQPITDWGRVRNNIQQRARVDAAVEAKDGRLFLFSGDQYFLYGSPQKLLEGSAFLDERYPRSIRGKFEQEGLTPLPALMFSGVDAAFRDSDDTFFFFAGNRFTHSTDPYALQRIRPSWGHVLNWLFEECRADAAFVLGDATYLTRKNQLTRYTGGAYGFVDEGFPISFPNVPEADPLLRVLRRFPDGLDAALAGSDGKLYAFKDGAFASSAAPDTRATIRDAWGRVRNVFVDNQRVDAAFASGGAVYLFCGDQYVRYSGGSYQHVDEGYPRRVFPNWNALEGAGQLPDGFPLPITAVAVGAANDVYFFGGTKYAGPGGATGDVKARWARVRNNIEQTGVVDAAMLDGGGRMLLFSGDQVYRYSSPDQELVDETYPRKYSNLYQVPPAFAGGLSAALQTLDGKTYFFSGQSYAPIGDPAPVPRPNAQDWGVVYNWIQSQSFVSAAFVDPAGKTYLFGGDQFTRYSTGNYDFSDEGYPLKIAGRWGNAGDAFKTDIDAALSFKSPVDNVQRLYLFKGSQYVRYSTADYSQVDAGYPKPLGTAHQVEGLWFRGLSVHEPNPNSSHLDDPIVSVEATYVDTVNGQPRINVFYKHEGGVQWRRQYVSGNWGTPVRVETLTDYLPFTRLDAAFVSADGTLHCFSGNQYASRPPGGGTMTAPVSIRDRWARVWNQFGELGRVDACLSMGDGRTYLFCNKQFIKYTGTLRPGAADFYVNEGYPRRLESSWALENVPVALATEFQAAGYDLCRDASGKIHFFNGTRYTFSGNAGPDALLASRWGKVENRFKDLGRVDGAYRAENGKLYLFCDTQYTRYSDALDPGSPDFYADESYPRHVTTGWASEGVAGQMPETWSALGSAVFRDASATYVFSGSSFTSSLSPAPAPVIPQWANVRNELQSQNRVDAGFTAGGSTFVFGGDQYVRYSGGYDGFSDEGYPKVIAHLEAADGLFPGLPVQLQSGLRAFFAGKDGQLHAFGTPPAAETEPQLYVASGSPDVLRPLKEKWGIVENKLWDDEFVNAALMREGKLFLFSGDQYLRYSGTDRRNVDEGYPRRISTSYAQELGVPALSPVMNQGVDAALSIAGTAFHFVQDQCVGTDRPQVAEPLVDRWGLVDNRLQATRKLDAAFVAPSGKLYLFAQAQVSQYSGDGREYVDEEYPRTIATDLGKAWPSDADGDFRSDLDTAAGFEGRTYLFQKARHVRFSDFRLGKPDAGYPLSNAGKLVDRFDFELGRLPDWWRIKQLFDDASGQSVTALDYLDEPPALPDDRVKALSLATQWPVVEIQALQAILALQPDDLLDGRTLVRLARCFELADRMGTTPSKLKAQVWDLAFGTAVAQHRAAADVLYGLIKVATDPKDWPTVSRSIADPVQSAKRDALVAYLVETLHKRDANDLYEHLLLDVEMDASSTTSRIVEAINSVQLYYHRALIHLEQVDPQHVWPDLKTWWPWMKSYRVWEANRKVFLHPESYIRPELRTEKSPAFEALEEKLLQDEITPASVEEGYQRYLEAFNEISRLRIVGGYRYQKPTDVEGVFKDAVFMIGVSRTDPPVYHYRLGEVQADKTIDWEPWQKLEITVNAERVQPVFAFNRLFIFWLEANQYNDASFSQSGTYSADSPSVKHVKLTLKFSFYNFNKEWVAPQSVLVNPGDKSDPESFPTVFTAQAADDVHLSALNPVGDDNDDIFLKLRFLFWEWDVGRLTAGLDLAGGAPYWRFAPVFLQDPKALFPTQTGISLGDVSAIVPWGSHAENDEGTWFSFDAKGGTFLCRPVNASSLEHGKILDRAFDRVSAAFRAPSGDVFVFNTESRGGALVLCSHRHVFGGTWEEPIFLGDPAWPWGRPTGALQADPSSRIRNAVLGLDGTTYVLLGDRYFTYSGTSYFATEEHFVSLMPGGSPDLGQLTSGAATVSWDDAVKAGNPLLRAFKHPAEEKAVLVMNADKGLGAVLVTLDELRDRSRDKDTKKSPFDDWDGLDAVFQVNLPEPTAVFTRGRSLVKLTWSSQAFEAGTLGELPAGVSGLSTAFRAADGILYVFAGDQYGKADPADLGANVSFHPAATRWGRPCLFPWLLGSVDGAVVAGNGTLYLFSKGYCLRYGNLPAGSLDRLVMDDPGEPPLVPAVWKSDLGWVFPFNLGPAIEQVAAAFARNGRAFLLGRRGDGRTFTARYTQTKQGPPFAPDLGYPMPVSGIDGQLTTDFYAQMLGEDQQFAIARLTSHTAEQFGRELFKGGVKQLLSLATQEKDELPKFITSGTPGLNELRIDATFVTEYPGKGEPGGLDFRSPNAFYYREIFFHIPHLIGQALRQAQRFDEAKVWYEYVFDPTHPANGDARPYWRFQEFRVDDELQGLDNQIAKYREDPFDPHRIAELRPLAYRKAFVMAYLDNLLEWGDNLFRQYTRESIGEATMLYVLAADLLGKKPEELGKRRMKDADTSYVNVRDQLTQTLTDEILELENGVPPPSGHVPPSTIHTPNDTLFNPYFYIPENDQFVEYWDRVGDRLWKIRHGMDIDGVKRSLALFEPPLDVMALVKAFASGAGLAQALADFNTPVPHYRFSFMLAKAKELTGRLISLGGALLSALEKKDAEELSLLRNTQEHAILDLQLKMKEQQLEGAKHSLAALQEGLKNAQVREGHYARLLAEGLSAYERTQVTAMIVGQVFSQIANVFGTASSIGYAIPQVGSPFAMTYGGIQLGHIVQGLQGAFHALAEMSSFQSSLAATLGGWDRRAQDWKLQMTLAVGDTRQIGYQIKAAEVQVAVANQEIQIQRRQIKNNESIDAFMRSKFTSQQLYQWMVGKLSAVYFQTYHLALQHAKAAQRAMQFELGLPETQVQYVGAGYWDSLKKGLQCGEQLQLDLDRLEKAHLEANARRLEITRYVSLAQVDPLALVHLKEKGSCEFDLAEALFDGDFPGHYCRQIKSASLSFPAVVGPYDNFNATLTQLAHRTLLAPNKKAVKTLLQGPAPGDPDLSADVLRVDWRPNQAVALSRGVNDSGQFQLNFQDERFLPFEGTGAVSTWRLEVNGVEGQRHRDTLADVILTVQYTALSGGDAFAEVVKALVAGKEQQRAWLLNLAYDFPDEWAAFMNKPENGMSFAVERARLPGATGKKVTGVYLHYELVSEPAEDIGRQAISLNDTPLKPGASKTGLGLPIVQPGQDPTKAANRWKLTVPGAAGARKLTPATIKNIALVVTYPSKPSF